MQRPCNLAAAATAAAATTATAATTSVTATATASSRICTSIRQEFCLESRNDVEGRNSQPHHDLRDALSKRQG